MYVCMYVRMHVFFFPEKIVKYIFSEFLTLLCVTGSGVASLINPPKTVEELEMEEQEGHENYVRTHNAYFVGKKKCGRRNVHSEDQI